MSKLNTNLISEKLPLDIGGTHPSEAIKVIQEAFALVPPLSREEAYLNLDADQEYGCAYANLMLEWVRPETEEEKEAREKRAEIDNARRIAILQRELARLTKESK